jgi:hypothetical protein
MEFFPDKILRLRNEFIIVNLFEKKLGAKHLLEKQSALI